MAERARLIPPTVEQMSWPWHQLETASLPVDVVGSGARRLEAESYLADGYGIRIAIAAKEGCQLLTKLAASVLPHRVKGTLVEKHLGRPYLAATQVLDFRPVARRWLSTDKIKNVDDLSVSPGDILVTRSGSVGKAIVAFDAHNGFIISDDLLRVSPRDSDTAGWVYAFLRSTHARKMMTASHYGHVIKHLEPEHLDDIPVPSVPERVIDLCSKSFAEIIEKRNAAFAMTLCAEKKYADRIRSPEFTRAETFTIPIGSMCVGGRRLDGNFHNSHARAIEAYLSGVADKMQPLRELVAKVIVPGRFKHVYGELGIPYLDSADILECGPELTKKVLSLDEKRRVAYMTRPGAILMPCSGQTHGNIGQAVLATQHHAEKVLSNHILRIEPDEPSRVPMGYLLCVLGHPAYGRPLVVRTTFGSSVPEIPPEAIENLAVPRFADGTEEAIHELMSEAATLRDEADQIEAAMAAEADRVITGYLAA